MSLLHRTPHSGDELPELTPAQLAELDVLDAALAGDEIADDALATLVRDVRAAAPELGTEGTQRMNDRLGVALDPAGRPAGRRVPRLRGLLHGPGAVATSLLLVVAVGGTAYVMGPGDDGARLSAELPREPVQVDELSNRFSRDQGNTYRQKTAPATTNPLGDFLTGSAGIERSSGVLQGLETRTNRAPGSATEQSSSLSSVLKQSPSTLAAQARSSTRAVERAVDLGVRVKNGELPDAAKKVSAITRQANGYVASSEVNLGRVGAGSASFSLRVDTTQLDRAVDRLGALGTVTAQNERSQDITSTLDSAERQLGDARKDRAALLRALAKAQSADQIASLRRQIAANRAALARLDAQVKRVERRAQLTTVELLLEAPAKGDPSADDGNWTLGDAADDAWSALRAILGGLLVAAAVLAPFALIGGAGYAIWRRRRRTARERTLGG